MGAGECYHSDHSGCVFGFWLTFTRAPSQLPSKLMAQHPHVRPFLTCCAGWYRHDFGRTDIEMLKLLLPLLSDGMSLHSSLANATTALLSSLAQLLSIAVGVAEYVMTMVSDGSKLRVKAAELKGMSAFLLQE